MRLSVAITAESHRAAMRDGLRMGTPAIAGTVLGLCTSHPGAWPAALIAVTVLSRGVIAESRQSGRAAWMSVACGMAAWQFATTGWAVFAVRTDTTMTLMWQALVPLAIVAHALICTLGPWLVLRATALRGWPHARNSPWLHALVWFLAWSVGDVLRQVGAIGNGYGGLGVAVVDAPGLPHLLPLVGAQGLSMLMLLVASLSAVLMADTPTRVSSGLRALCAAACPWLTLFACALSLPIVEEWTNDESTRLTVVALDVPRLQTHRLWRASERERSMNLLMDNMKHAPPHAVVVTSESFMGDPPPAQADGQWGDLIEAVNKRQVHALVGMPMVARDDASLRMMNTVQQVSPGRRAVFAKARLVPGAEWLPGSAWLAPMYRQLFGGSGRGEQAATPELQQPLYVEGHELGIAICHELSFALLMAERATASHALLVLSDDSWIRSSLYQAQMLGLSRVRALEAGRSLVRVRRGAAPVAIDHRGNEMPGDSGTGARSTLYALPMRSGATPYHRFAAAWACLPFAMAALFWLAAARGSRPIAPPSGVPA